MTSLLSFRSSCLER